MGQRHGRGGVGEPEQAEDRDGSTADDSSSNLLSRAKLFRSFRGGEDILTGTFHDVSDRRHQAGPLHKQDPATFWAPYIICMPVDPWNARVSS